jgi:serine phosphatase RsbU (regulator of sigma subunit)
MTISAVRDAGRGAEPSPDEPAADDRAESTGRDRTRSIKGLHLGTVTVVVVGLVITAGLALGAQSVHKTNEDRLLRQRVREAAAVVTAAIPNVQGPLASAAVVAEATGAEADPFTRVMSPLVTAGRPFVSASLWSVTDAQPRALIVVGARPELETRAPDEIARFLRGAVGKGAVHINDLLSARDRRLGYAYAATGPNTSYVAYAEAALPANRRATVDKNSAFSDLDYSLYLGGTPTRQQLLASSTDGAVLEGRAASESVPFGDSKLLLVMAAKKELGGNLMARLPWGLAGGGLLLTLAGASLFERLLRRRDDAEALARENDQLYKEQRTVAQTLQHSLLPDVLPSVEGLEIATRYVAGVEGIDVGGDWYDVMHLDDHRIAFVVGDVSGRGLRAATTMAELRYAVRAYAMQGDAPDTILAKVSRLIDVGRDGHFATAVCGVLDLETRVLTIANAGHPEPLLVADDSVGGKQARFVATQIGPPLGVRKGGSYVESTLTIPMNGTLLAYTDGLVERRGETLDIGLERLRKAALDPSGSIDDMLTTVLAQAIPSGSADDTAILGLRWQN